MQNPPTKTGFLVTAVASAVIGAVPIALFASAENGYIAGYFVLPIFFLMAAVCLIQLVSAILFIANNRFAIALYLLLSVLFVPAFAFAFAMAAEHFEIGAYRIEPMRPVTIR